MSIPLNILLADDDSDDCLFLKEILEELPVTSKLKAITDGIQLMKYLFDNENNLPQAVFLDLNMPLKNGTECLTEIKSDEKLKNVPVIIMSTSFHAEIVEKLYEKGANYYICKPGDFFKLKKVIFEAITKVTENSVQPQRADFVIE